MTPDRLSPLRFVLALILLLELSATLPASSPPRQNTGPVFAEWLDNVSIGRPTNRTTVIRVAALGMALALFIMFYKKH